MACTDMFCAFLFGGVKDVHSHVTPPSYLGTAAGAGDGTVICRMVWEDEFIAAAVTAAKGGVLVPVDRLRHSVFISGTMFDNAERRNDSKGPSPSPSAITTAGPGVK